jgi:CRP-like cAMP-binding protein
MIAIMSDPIIRSIASLQHTILTLRRNEELFLAAHPVTKLFVVLEGGVDLMRVQLDGRRVILQRAREMQVLAEASVYADRYHCDAVAARPTRCLAVAVPDFRHALENDLSFALMWQNHLARELQRTRQLTELLARRTVRDRLDGWLETIGNGLPEKGKWLDLADALGVSPEALYREIARRRAT